MDFLIESNDGQNDIADVQNDVADVQNDIADVQNEIADGSNDIADVQNNNVFMLILLISLYYQNKNINLKKYTTPSFMLTQSSDVRLKIEKIKLIKR